MREALIIVDMQKEFYNLRPESFDNKIIPNLLKILQNYRNEKREIIHVITKYCIDKSDWPEARKSEDSIWCMEGTESAEIIEGFEPLGDEKVIIKTRFSSFYNTN